METLRALAVELGLAGPMMATVASPELLDFINWTLCRSWASTRTAPSPVGARSWSPPPNQATSPDHPAAGRPDGRWPSFRAWETAGEDHPTRRAYVRRFGSWAAAIEAAAKQRSAMLMVSVQEYDIADVRPVFGKEAE